MDENQKVSNGPTAAELPADIQAKLDKQGEDQAEALKAQQVNSLAQSSRILGNIQNLIRRGLFPGEIHAHVAEANRYIDALKAQADEMLAVFRGDEKKQRAEAKRAKRSKTWKERLLGKNSAETNTEVANAAS